MVFPLSAESAIKSMELCFQSSCEFLMQFSFLKYTSPSGVETTHKILLSPSHVQCKASAHGIE